MRVRILAWVEPPEQILNRVRQKHSVKEVEVIKRSQINIPIFRFIRQQQSSDVGPFYFLCRDLGMPFERAYLLGLSLFCKVKTKRLIDSNGAEENPSWAVFLVRGIPRALWRTFLSLSALFLSYAAITVLANRVMVRVFGVKSNRDPKQEKQEDIGGIAYFWSGFESTNFNFRVGGEISHIVGFFGGLKKIGYKACMVSTRPILHDKFDAPNMVIDERSFPPWPGEIKEMAYNWKVLWNARKLMPQWRPSLVYHRASGLSFVGVLVSVLYRLPFVFEINSPQDMVAKNWGSGRFNSMAKKIEMLSIMYASKVAVVSNEVRRHLVMQGAPFDKIIVNPNGVDPDFFRANGSAKKVIKEYGLSDKTIVGFIGSFNPYHGLLTLAHAVRLVVKETDKVHFLILGDGSLRSDFESIIACDNVSAYVTLKGKVPHETVPTLLDACDILVSPHQNLTDGSTFYGSPTKIFEYMAMGKGIVASNVGQLGQVLKHEETALLVKPEDPEDLAKGIIRLAQDNVLRRTLGRKAREAVVSNYTWEKNAQRVIEPFFGKES